MRQILISDTTIKNIVSTEDKHLTFKEKLEIAKLLDRLNVSVIEVGPMLSYKSDSLLIKSMSQSVENSIMAVSVGLDEKQIEDVWQALSNVKKPRLQVSVPLSPARMEYVCHKKADAISDAVNTSVSSCVKYCSDVEFVAEDATRADLQLLYSVLNTAIKAGAKTVTICDSAGVMLPEEFGIFIKSCFDNVPGLSDVSVGISVSNDFNLADACTMTAIQNGISEIKVVSGGNASASLGNVAKILTQKGDDLGVGCGLKLTEINRVQTAINGLIFSTKSEKSPFDNGVSTVEKDVSFSQNDSFDDIMKAVVHLGYDLNETDKVKVWDGFKKIASRKEKIGLSELEVIIASESMQVPSVYSLSNYMVTTGNALDIVAHIKLKKDNEELDGVSLGDGPIDAAFLAIEKITGCHYELDDFQIQSITEGREAMGQTVVKLRSGGKVYSGRGLSTDIVGSGIEAYLNALNKIVYEEENS